MTLRDVTRREIRCLFPGQEQGMAQGGEGGRTGTGTAVVHRRTTKNSRGPSLGSIVQQVFGERFSFLEWVGFCFYGFRCRCSSLFFSSLPLSTWLPCSCRLQCCNESYRVVASRPHRPDGVSLLRISERILFSPSSGLYLPPQHKHTWPRVERKTRRPTTASLFPAGTTYSLQMGSGAGATRRDASCS